MRELTMDEMDVVSGGGEEPLLNPTASRTGDLTNGFWIMNFDSPTWGDGDTSNGDQSGWDKDGDGVADYYDEDPDDPNNNTMVTKPSENTTGVEVGYSWWIFAGMGATSNDVWLSGGVARPGPSIDLVDEEDLNKIDVGPDSIVYRQSLLNFYNEVRQTMDVMARGFVEQNYPQLPY